MSLITIITLLPIIIFLGVVYFNIIRKRFDLILMVFCLFSLFPKFFSDYFDIYISIAPGLNTETLIIYPALIGYLLSVLLKDVKAIRLSKQILIYVIIVVALIIIRNILYDRHAWFNDIHMTKQIIAPLLVCFLIANSGLSSRAPVVKLFFIIVVFSSVYASIQTLIGYTSIEDLYMEVARYRIEKGTIISQSATPLVFSILFLSSYILNRYEYFKFSLIIPLILFIIIFLALVRTLDVARVGGTIIGVGTIFYYSKIPRLTKQSYFMIFGLLMVLSLPLIPEQLFERIFYKINLDASSASEILLTENWDKRPQMWSAAIEIISEYPLTGVGYTGYGGGIGYHMKSIRQLTASVHNTILMIGVLRGVFGMLAAIWIYLKIFIFLKKIILAKYIHRNDNLIALTGFGFIIYIFIFGLVQGTDVGGINQSQFWMALGILISSESLNRKFFRTSYI